GNRAMAYGDGLFETLRVHHGTLSWWGAHWARLSLGATRLGIALPGEGAVREAAASLFADGGDGVLKLLLARGAGGRGYAPDPDAAPEWIVSRHPLPAPPPGPLVLHWCTIRLARQPLLAGLKHCNRLEQVLARAECDRAGADEGLLRDGEGRVVAGIAANLFVLRDGAWLTPPVDDCGVAGMPANLSVLRAGAWLTQRWDACGVAATCRGASLEPLHAGEAHLSVAGVESADAVFLCNAVRGILPVARAGARDWLPHPAV